VDDSEGGGEVKGGGNRERRGGEAARYVENGDVCCQLWR